MPARAICWSIKNVNCLGNRASGKESVSCPTRKARNVTGAFRVLKKGQCVTFTCQTSFQVDLKTECSFGHT